jgi:exopolysaccharide biosynthesis polyprenyl glycosylphosphotransferase
LHVSTADLSVARPAAARRPGLRGTLARHPELVKIGMDATMLALGILTATLASLAAHIPVAPLPVLILYPLVILGLFKVRRIYAPRLRVEMLDDLRQILALTALSAMAIVSVRALANDDEPYLTPQSIRLWLFTALFLSLGHLGRSWLQRQAWMHGEAARPTLIIGAGTVGRRVAKRLLQHPECGLKPVGFLDKDPLDEGVPGTEHLHILGASWDLDRAIAEYDVRHVIVTFSKAPHSVLLGVIDRCQELGLTVSVVPRLFEKVSARGNLDHFGGLPVFTIDWTDPKGAQFGLKYAADRVLAASGLLLTLPFLLLGALAVRVSMGRPIFYRQTRVGLDGKVFEIVKFRSMKPAAGDGAEEVPNGSSSDGDESHRLTRVGAFLRRASIDELPQLWNVLRGEMSLVGPRPERPEFVQVFERHVYRYGDRHRVKSGMTGWAQVHGKGRGNDRFSQDALSDRVEWDNYYIENWSLWLDMKIVLMTVAAVFRFRQT